MLLVANIEGDLVLTLLCDDDEAAVEIVCAAFDAADGGNMSSGFLPGVGDTVALLLLCVSLGFCVGLDGREAVS